MERPQKRLQRLAGFVTRKSGLHIPAQEAVRQAQAEKALAEARQRAQEQIRFGRRSRPRFWTPATKGRKGIKAKRKHSRKANVRRLRQNKRRTWRNAK